MYLGSVCGNGHDDWISNPLPSVFRSDYLPTELIHSNCWWQLYFYICNLSSSQHVAYLPLYYKLMNNMYIVKFTILLTFYISDDQQKRWQVSKRSFAEAKTFSEETLHNIPENIEYIFLKSIMNYVNRWGDIVVAIYHHDRWEH